MNNDIFTRVPDVGSPVNLTLTVPNGQPGRDAYEILAFFAQSASLALGTKEVDYFDSNIDLESFGMPGGTNIRPNHSYQFNHDASQTWDFYDLLKTVLEFDATYGSGALAGTSLPATDQLSRKPNLSGVAPIGDNLAESRPLALESWPSLTYKPLEFSKLIRGHLRTEYTSPILSENVDLTMFDWFGKRFVKTLPDIEPIDHNSFDGDGYVANDKVFDTLDVSLASISG